MNFKTTNFYLVAQLFTIFVVSLIMAVVSCSPAKEESSGHSVEKLDMENGLQTDQEDESLQYDTSEWVDMMRILPDAVYDIRYATENNFMNQVIYDCPGCLMRKEAGEALVAIHNHLTKKGLGLKFFDCYRPAPYQEKLWSVMPDPRYVAPPEKGSNHSRGQAIDLTIVNLDTGEELNMGTTYDFFGREAHPGYQKLPKDILGNRRLLSDVMQQFGYVPITSEWWHFDFKGTRFEVSDFLWSCP
jgi:D-alanyl-D-alanine dipeptidase